MARPKRRARQSRRITRLDFGAIEITGALLPPEVVTRAAASGMSDQSDESYGVPRGLKLRDEIARYYQIGLAHWERFSASRDNAINAPETFILDVLKDCFGFATIARTGPTVISDRHFPIRHAAEKGRIPIVIAPLAPEESHKSGIDEALSQFGDDTRRRSATQLLQEYLNADEDALWGLVSDGNVLRLMRDNASLTRPAWIEANLEKIFAEGLFADFSALWLLIHASRFGKAGAAPSDCALERWRERGRIDGSAAKEKLRLGVEAALIEFGRGFLENSSNTALREALQSGRLTRQAYYEELLRLVYRLIFLFAAEDRNLLHVPGAPDTARKAYRGGYSVGRLRERSTRNTALDRHHDTWEGLRALFAALAEGEPSLGLGALGGLFAQDQLVDLENARIENRRLLKAIWHLSWFRPEGQPMTRVNWRDMETEELGSVYESLLELTPELDVEARHFTFAEGDATRGNARKVSGSYYTPDELVQLLLDTTLDPVLDAAEARNRADPVAEILKLAIIDPACGSGHFLLGAARRAAARIARHRSPGAPSQDVFQHALREVVSHCIHGVDRNPMAIELCKVALWIEALEPGKPLSFLDARIRCGDSLIGVFDYKMLRDGIPDEAFTAMAGDDKTVARAYQRLNRDQRDGKAATGFIAGLRAPEAIVDGARKIADMPEDTLKEIGAKARAFDHLQHTDQWRRLKTACDMLVAAFFLPKTGDEPDARSLAGMPVPTTEAIWRAAAGNAPQDHLQAGCIEVAENNSAFHWPLEFPAVMARGGFDAVVGNPPWERIKLQEQEFFAARDPEIANAANKAERDKLIKTLEKAEYGTPRHALFDAFIEAKRNAEAASFFTRKSGRFPLTGTGDVNTYALFAEHFAHLARTPKKTEAAKSIAHLISETGGVRPTPPGRAGLIVPTGIATDSSTSAFFGDLIANHRLKTLIDFENREKLFPAVDSRMKFSILSIGPSDKAEFAFFLLNTGMLEEKERRFVLSPDQIARINPNTLTAPVFRSRADAELTAKLYDRAPVLIEERPDDPRGDVNPWGITFQRMLDMSNDSGHFRGEAQLGGAGFRRSGSGWENDDGRRYVPLYEAKMIHHYDHRWATYEGEDEETGARDVTLAEKQNPDFEPKPRYWVPEQEVRLRAARVPARLKSAFRDDNPDRCLTVLAEWVAGSVDELDPVNPAPAIRAVEMRLIDVLGRRAVSPTVVGRSFAKWLGQIAPRAAEMQRQTPLTSDDLVFLKEGPRDLLELTGALIDRKQPRWLMGWRDICRSTDERTVIASVFPIVGVGHTMPLLYSTLDAERTAVLLAQLVALAFDFVARQKVGGTHLTYTYFNQLPALTPDQFNQDDFAYLKPRILELTYTSHTMRPWAEDLGFNGAPFGFDPIRRAHLRAELDAFFARKYGLSRDELRYVLDPADVKGPDYPSETFRGLKRNEERDFGEYRTRRLVLEAFDRLTGA